MENKIIVLIMGKSGCGKSTLERNLIKHFPSQFKKVVSSTTRPIRDGEKHGVDYWFLTEDEYDQTDFIQTTTFAGYRYGSSVSEYQTTHPFPVLCVVPSSAKVFTQTLAQRFPTWSTFNIWFDISNIRLVQNMRKRGDTNQMIEKRINQDKLDEQFLQSGLYPDLIVYDFNLNENLHNVVAKQIELEKLRLDTRNTAENESNY